MNQIHRPSVRPPGEAEALASIPVFVAPETAAMAARLVARAEAMGLIELAEGHAVSNASVIDTVHAFARAGIGRMLVSEADVERDVSGALDLLLA